jgi:hypothetical protein
MKTSLKTLTTTAQVVYGPKVGSSWIYIRALGNDCYIGGSDVTDTIGLKITTNDTISLFIKRGQVLYGVSKTGSHSLIVLEPLGA